MSNYSKTTELQTPELQTVSNPELRTIRNPELQTVSNPELQTVSNPELQTVSNPNAIYLQLFGKYHHKHTRNDKKILPPNFINTSLCFS